MMQMPKPMMTMQSNYITQAGHWPNQSKQSSKYKIISRVLDYEASEKEFLEVILMLGGIAKEQTNPMKKA